MAYRLTKRAATQRAKLTAMRRGKATARLARPAPDYPPELPELRREIIIIDHDFGERRYHLRLFRTSRVDCYRVEIDGRPWQARIGWSRVLVGLRKALPRVAAA